MVRVDTISLHPFPRVSNVGRVLNSIPYLRWTLPLPSSLVFYLSSLSLVPDKTVKGRRRRGLSPTIRLRTPNSFTRFL